MIMSLPSSSPPSARTIPLIVTESAEYRENMADLNRALLEFVKKSLDKNPHCELTPIFRRYYEHLIAVVAAATVVAAGAGGDAKHSTSCPFTPGSTRFSFGNTEDQDKVVHDQPPKTVDEEAVYTKRCQVFVMKDAEFADRGVGILHLKPVKDYAKAQLIVRAEGNIGQVLINLIVGQGHSLPCQRMSAKTVMITGLPMPEDSNVVPILLLVNSVEEADELMVKIENYTK
ncbi:nuclear pore complex protein Nup50-like [Drosophila miranda]|uniref:nuclear pore complex protein Nup50-like n=1 Tax=Drosophila miranda TaxID=7229 RepID=UPI0007E6C7E9|nr:nuclear pore complex protein Nup50-like [Drosophila miranda]